MCSCLQGISIAYLKLSKHYVLMLYIVGIKTFETTLFFCHLKFSWCHSLILSTVHTSAFLINIPNVFH